MNDHSDGVPDRPTICQLLITLGVGGAEVLAFRLARQLRSRYRFVFICLDEVNLLGEQLREEGFRVHHVGRRPGLDWSCSARIAAVLRQEQVDLVHAHQYTPFFYALIARLRYRRPPVLFTEHGRNHPDTRSPRRVLANRVLVERRDRIVAVGEAVRRALVDFEGFRPDRVEVIHNGVDLAPYEGSRSGRSTSRRLLGLDETALVLIQVARLNQLKDHRTALRTMERVVAIRPDARLLLVGIGETQDAVEEEITRRGLRAHIRLLGRRRDIERLLPAADLFLLTSISEGIPLTLIEAMAAGLPIVATDVGGVREVAPHGEVALLASAGDDRQLAAHVLTLAGDRDLCRRMGDSGRSRSKAMFPERLMHARYVERYDQMLRGRTSAVAAGRVDR